jgi:hypothetical protein
MNIDNQKFVINDIYRGLMISGLWEVFTSPGCSCNGAVGCISGISFVYFKIFLLVACCCDNTFTGDRCVYPFVDAIPKLLIS